MEYQDDFDTSYSIHEQFGTLTETDMDDVKVGWACTSGVVSCCDNEGSTIGIVTVCYVQAMLVDTNPWLLGLTLFISVIHTAFDLLAFKNDIQFWRGRENFEGVCSSS